MSVTIFDLTNSLEVRPPRLCALDSSPTPDSSHPPALAEGSFWLWVFIGYSEVEDTAVSLPWHVLQSLPLFWIVRNTGSTGVASHPCTTHACWMACFGSMKSMPQYTHGWREPSSPFVQLRKNAFSWTMNTPGEEYAVLPRLGMPVETWNLPLASDDGDDEQCHTVFLPSIDFPSKILEKITFKTTYSYELFPRIGSSTLHRVRIAVASDFWKILEILGINFVASRSRRFWRQDRRVASRWKTVASR